MGNHNASDVALFHLAIEHVIRELNLSGDSINGLMDLVGQTTTLESKIQVRNHSMIVHSDNHAVV